MRSRSSTHIHRQIEVLSYNLNLQGFHAYIQANDLRSIGADRTARQEEDRTRCIPNYAFLNQTETSFPLPSTDSILRFVQQTGHALSDVNQAQADYFFPVFLADFLVVFLVDFFLSSFFWRAFWEATFFTIFCSSMRKARRMLHHYSTPISTHFPTDHAGTCGRGYHHKHGWQSAGKHQFSSYLCRKCRESIE